MKTKKWLCSLVAVSVAVMTLATAANAKMFANPFKPVAPAKIMAAPAPVPAADDRFTPRSPLEYLINGSLLGYELAPMLQLVPEEEQSTVMSAVALRAGLLNYEKEVTAKRTLTGNNATIDHYLKQFPVVLNKIQNSSSEVEEEMIQLVRDLSKVILKNQTAVSESEIDEDSCAFLVMSFGYQKVFADGSLTTRVTQILQQELATQLEQEY